MKNLLPNLLMVLGFCVGTVGATGFHSPSASANGATGEAAATEEASTEAFAWPLLAGGLLLLAAGAALGRKAKSEAQADGKQGMVAAIAQDLAKIQGLVSGMNDSKESMNAADLMARIDDMRTGPLFDLGSQSDAFAAQIGFDDYAKVWGEFATCERLLNRSWSMAADGHLDESRAELPLAQAAIGSAVEACAALA